jgi:hypothetical protein
MSSALYPKLTEREFMDQVTQLAEIRGWSWAHFRPAMTTKGWRTPVSGPLGKGWPDLVLVRGTQLYFAELKRDRKSPMKEAQWAVMAVLNQPAPYFIWTPDDWDAIETALQSQSYGSRAA